MCSNTPQADSFKCPIRSFSISRGARDFAIWKVTIRDHNLSNQNAHDVCFNLFFSNGNLRLFILFSIELGAQVTNI